MIASFGPKIFTVTNKKTDTFYDFQHSGSYETESQELLGKKPSTLDKGPGKDSLSFSITLMASLGVNPRKELEKWQEILAAGTAYPFILGKKPFGKNKWKLVGLDDSEYIIDGQGNVLQVKINLKFDEFVRNGKKTEAKKEAASKGRASATASVNAKGKEIKSAVVSLTSPADKSRASAMRKKL
jgi:phage protein U